VWTAPFGPLTTKAVNAAATALPAEATRRFPGEHQKPYSLVYNLTRSSSRWSAAPPTAAHSRAFLHQSRRRRGQAHDDVGDEFSSASSTFFRRSSACWGAT